MWYVVQTRGGGEEPSRLFLGPHDRRRRGRFPKQSGRPRWWPLPNMKSRRRKERKERRNRAICLRWLLCFKFSCICIFRKAEHFLPSVQLQTPFPYTQAFLPPSPMQTRGRKTLQVTQGHKKEGGIANGSPANGKSGYFFPSPFFSQRST